VRASACFISHLKTISFYDKIGFWYDCAGIFDQMATMVVKGGETSGGWKKRVVACPLNGLQALNPSP